MAAKKVVRIKSLPPEKIKSPYDVAAHEFVRNESFPGFPPSVTKTPRRAYRKDVREKFRGHPLLSLNNETLAHKMDSLKPSWLAPKNLDEYITNLANLQNPRSFMEFQGSRIRGPLRVGPSEKQIQGVLREEAQSRYHTLKVEAQRKKELDKLKENGGDVFLNEAMMDEPFDFGNSLTSYKGKISPIGYEKFLKDPAYNKPKEEIPLEQVLPPRMGLPEADQVRYQGEGFDPREISQKIVAHKRAEMADPRSDILREALARYFGSGRR